MNKKILIIGGTGFIGSHLVNFLKKKNFDITSVLRNKFIKNKNLNVKYIFFDFSKKKNFKILD